MVFQPDINPFSTLYDLLLVISFVLFTKVSDILLIILIRVGSVNCRLNYYNSIYNIQIVTLLSNLAMSIGILTKSSKEHQFVMYLKR